MHKSPNRTSPGSDSEDGVFSRALDEAQFFHIGLQAFMPYTPGLLESVQALLGPGPPNGVAISVTWWVLHIYLFVDLPM